MSEKKQTAKSIYLFGESVTICIMTVMFIGGMALGLSMGQGSFPGSIGTGPLPKMIGMVPTIAIVAAGFVALLLFIIEWYCSHVRIRAHYDRDVEQD